MQTLSIIIHEIAEDGLPDMDRLVGRVAFIFDGCIVSGWPLPRERFPELYTREHLLQRRGGAHLTDDEYLSQVGTLWEANSDVGRHGQFSGVTHWVEFPVPIFHLD